MFLFIKQFFMWEFPNILVSTEAVIDSSLKNYLKNELASLKILWRTIVHVTFLRLIPDFLPRSTNLYCQCLHANLSFFTLFLRTEIDGKHSWEVY